MDDADAGREAETEVVFGPRQANVKALRREGLSVGLKISFSSVVQEEESSKRRKS